MKSYSFLTIGKTKESAESTEFKKYIGVGSFYVVAVNPSKDELSEIYGNEQTRDPEYVVDGENGKEARITFIVKTDPEAPLCKGIELTTRLMFTMRNTPAYNRDNTKVQVIDNFGNFTWTDVEDAKAGKKILSAEGKERMIDTKYRMARVGECDLVDFLKKYLVVENAFEFKNGSWVKRADADDYKFSLDHINDYFKGDFSELREALKLQPNNKIKLLCGVRTGNDADGNPREYQAVASRSDLILMNRSGNKGLLKMEKELDNAKARGSYPNTEFKVQPLQEWKVEPTNLETASEPDPFGPTEETPWD